MNTLKAAGRGPVPLRHFGSSRVPGIVPESGTVDRPHYLVGDETAVAFHLHEDNLMPVIPRGVLLYCTRLRDPQPGDIAVLSFENGETSVRIIKDASDSGYETWHAYVEEDGSISDIRDFVGFDRLTAVAVVMGMLRHQG